MLHQPNTLHKTKTKDLHHSNDWKRIIKDYKCNEMDGCLGHQFCYHANKSKRFPFNKTDTAWGWNRVSHCFLSPTPKAMMQTRSLCIIYFPLSVWQKRVHVFKYQQTSYFHYSTLFWRLKGDQEGEVMTWTTILYQL